MTKEILAIGKIGVERRAKHIPPGEVIQVVRGPISDTANLVDIQWDGKEFSVFRSDLEIRAREIGK